MADCDFRGNMGGIVAAAWTEMFISECSFHDNFVASGDLFDVNLSMLSIYESEFIRNSGNSLFKLVTTVTIINGTNFCENQLIESLISGDDGAKVTVVGSQFHRNAASSALILLDTSLLHFSLSEIDRTLGIVILAKFCDLSLNVLMFNGTGGRTRPVIVSERSSGVISHCLFGEFSYAPVIKYSGNNIVLSDLMLTSPPDLAVDPPGCFNCTYSSDLPNPEEWDFGTIAVYVVVVLLVAGSIWKGKKYLKLIPRGLTSRKTV
jgi:hypothetical protein